MTYQKIDGVSYANGVKLNVEDIEIWEIEKSLDILTTQIEIKKIAADKLLDQRDDVIVHAFNNGFSAIRLGKLLNLTRQRIYEIVKSAQTKKEEEE